MRYLDQPLITFKIGHVSAQIYQTLEYVPPTYSANTVRVTANDALDEIASRVEVYGEESEARAWDLFRENMPELVEARYDISQLSKIRMP